MNIQYSPIKEVFFIDSSSKNSPVAQAMHEFFSSTE